MPIKTRYVLLPFAIAMAVPARPSPGHASELAQIADQALIDKAKVEVKTPTVVSNNLSPTAERISLRFRSLRLIKSSNGRRVCGEVSDDEGTRWLKFYTPSEGAEPQVEPFGGTDWGRFVEAQRQCQATIKKIISGKKLSELDRQSCSTSRLVSEAKFLQARFGLLYEVSC